MDNKDYLADNPEARKHAEKKAELMNKFKEEQLLDKPEEIPTEEPVAEDISAKEEREDGHIKEEPKVENWEHKYKVLQGTFKREKSNKELEIADIKSRLAKSEETNLELMRYIPTQKVEPKESQVIKDNKRLKDTLKDLFVDEKDADKFYDALDEYITTKTPSSDTSKYDTEIASLKSQLSNVTAREREQRQSAIVESLNEKYGDKWHEVQESEDFVNWANNDEPLSGKTYAEIYSNAVDKGNSKAIHQIYRQYFNESGIKTNASKKDVLKKHIIPGSHTSMKQTTGEPGIDEIRRLINNELANMKSNRKFSPDKLKDLQKKLITQMER